MLLSSFRHRAPAVVSALLAFIFAFSALFSVSFVNVAYAEGEDDTAVEDALKGLAPEEYNRDNKSFVDRLSDNDDEEAGEGRDTFAYVFRRVFMPNYMNNVSSATAAEGYSVPSTGYICDDTKGRGTVIYHNCDIPNIVTEVAQDIYGGLFPSGMSNAERRPVNSSWGIGVPPLPGDGKIPVDVAGSPIKYTGLELFGYDLRYTSYYGEWDHIKTLTKARLYANFGAYDSFKMGVSAVTSGVVGGFSHGTDAAVERLKNWDVAGAFGAFFTGFLEGGASSAINVFLDSSDLNVANTYGWYRVEFGDTLYNMRALTDNEIAQNFHKAIKKYIEQSGKPDTADLSEETKKMLNGPTDLKEEPGKCYIVLEDGNETLVTLTEDTKKACEEYYKNGSAVPESKWKSYRYEEPKKQSIDEWISDNQELMDYMNERFETPCEVDKSGDASKAVEAFKACFAEGMKPVVEKELNDTQDSLFDRFAKKLVERQMLAAFMEKAKEFNFNAPYNRYVCTDANGNDIKNGDEFVYAYDSEGNLNSACKQGRQPIQDGLYGNGYEKGQSTPRPGNDTRHIENVSSVWGRLFDGVAGGFTQANLDFAGTVTAWSNTVLSFVAMPILEKVGLDTILITFIQKMRDGVFYPLSVLAVAGGAIYVFYQALRHRNYREQMTSLVLIALTFMSGVILLNKPAETVKAVDSIPTLVESAVLGSIFSSGSEGSELCSTNTTVSDTSLFTNLDGTAVKTSLNDNIRRLMCENWQAFVLSPWLQGQWGTTMSELYSAESGHVTSLNNTNGAMVGDASVSLGGSTEVKNWAVYQLSLMTSGNLTQPGSDTKVFKVSPDMYRIVDAQAGPNNGAGTDSSYFRQWSRGDGRFAISLTGAITSVFGLVTVFIYSVGIIEAKLASTLLLLIAPAMFLVGLVPGQGRSKLKQYGLTIIALMVERVALVTLLAIMFKILMGASAATSGFILKTLVLTAICIVFILYRHELIGKIKSSITGDAGAFGGFESGRAFSRAVGNSMPRSLKNKAYEWRSRTKGAVAGAAAGAAAGSIRNKNGVPTKAGMFRSMAKGARQGAGIEGGREFNKQRRQGFGLLVSAQQASEAGREVAREARLEELGKIESEIAVEIGKRKDIMGKRPNNVSGTDWRKRKLEIGRIAAREYETRDSDKLTELVKIKREIDEREAALSERSHVRKKAHLKDGMTINRKKSDDLARERRELNELYRRYQEAQKEVAEDVGLRTRKRDVARELKEREERD